MNRLTRILAGTVLGIAAGTTDCQPQATSQDTAAPGGVERMTSLAQFQTYVFSSQPSWTGPVEIIDSTDPATWGQRMFTLAARAEDGRHLVLVQSATYNRVLGKKVRQGTLVYTSPNGFKVWGGGPQKWYSKILLQGARVIIKDPPAEDRIGYMLESPAGTFPALAVSGPVNEAELHALVDSLTPAGAYLDQQTGGPDAK
jgi:hypothetical protein